MEEPMTSLLEMPVRHPNREPARRWSSAADRRRWLGALAALGMALAGCGDDGNAREDKTYVLVHGAWMGGGGWAPVASELERQGATVHTLDLPAHGADTT